MKKTIAAEILLVLLLVPVIYILTGRDEVRDIDADAVVSACEPYVTQDRFSGERAYEMSVKRNFGLNMNDYPAFVYYGNERAMDVNEFLWVDAGNEKGAKEILASLEKRKIDQITAFTGYGPDQVAMLEKAQVFTCGRYAFYICSPYSGEWYDVIKKLVY